MAREVLMNKEGADEFKELLGRVIKTELECQRAVFAKEEARWKLNQFIHTLEFPPKEQDNG